MEDRVKNNPVRSRSQIRAQLRRTSSHMRKLVALSPIPGQSCHFRLGIILLHPGVKICTASPYDKGVSTINRFNGCTDKINIRSFLLK